MDGGTIRRKLIHRASFRASVLHLSELNAVLKGIAPFRCLLTTPSLLSTPPAGAAFVASLATLAGVFYFGRRKQSGELANKRDK